MSEGRPIDAARFAALADAYGGDLARWPAAERAGATAALARDPALADWLARAARLDARLDGYAVPAGGAALVGRMLAGAPTAFWTRARLWWSGLGLAGAAVAGLAAGVIGAGVVLPAHPEAALTEDALGVAFGESEFAGAGEAAAEPPAEASAG